MSDLSSVVSVMPMTTPIAEEWTIYRDGVYAILSGKSMVSINKPPNGIIKAVRTFTTIGEGTYGLLSADTCLSISQPDNSKSGSPVYPQGLEAYFKDRNYQIGLSYLSGNPEGDNVASVNQVMPFIEGIGIPRTTFLDLFQKPSLPAEYRSAVLELLSK